MIRFTSSMSICDSASLAMTNGKKKKERKSRSLMIQGVSCEVDLTDFTSLKNDLNNFSYLVSHASELALQHFPMKYIFILQPSQGRGLWLLVVVFVFVVACV